MKFILGIILSYGCIFIPGSWAGTYYDGRTGSLVGESFVVGQGTQSRIIILGEKHGLMAHHSNQKKFLSDFTKISYKPVHVGMEFFEYPHQEIVDKYVQGMILEPNFLKAIHWTGTPFVFYRFQVRIPLMSRGRTIALNIPREITTKIVKAGLLSLTEMEKGLLPPDFALGSDSMFARFSEAMQEHIKDKSKLMDYFTAQSLWDDTMAWRAAEFVKNNEGTLVIIVGDFHLAYLDGLVNRLRARGVDGVLSISHIHTEGLTHDERMAMILPHAKYGVRADYIFDADK